MAKGYVIYNPLAGNGQAQEDAQLLQIILDEELEYSECNEIHCKIGAARSITAFYANKYSPVRCRPYRGLFI